MVYLAIARPIGLWAYTVILYWVWGSAVGIFNRHAFDSSSGDFATLAIAQLYFLLGAISLLIAYCSTKPNKIARPLRVIEFQWTHKQVFICIIVLSALAYKYQPLPLAMQLQALEQATNAQVYSNCIKILNALVAVTVIQVDRPRYLRILALFVLFVILYKEITSGSRSHAVYAFVPIYIAAVHIVAYRPSRTHISVIVACLLVTLTFAQTTRVLFGVRNTLSDPSISVEEYLGTVVKGIFDSDVSQDSKNGLTKSMTTERLMAVDNLAAAIVYVSQGWDLLLGESMWTGFASTIFPRFLFPDKPDKVMAEDFFNARRGQYYDTLTNPIFEFYVNFGLVGIIIGMLFLGYLWRMMEHHLSIGMPTSTSKSIAYIIFCMSVLNSEQEMATYLFDTLRIIAFVFILGILLYFLGHFSGKSTLKGRGHDTSQAFYR